MIVNNIADENAEKQKGIYKLTKTKQGIFKKNDTAVNEDIGEKKKDNSLLRTTREITRDNGDRLWANQELVDVDIYNEQANKLKR